jgi:hypothetical protein
MLAAFLDDIRDGDMIAPRRMAERLRLPMTRLSRLAHLNRNTMTTHPGSPAVQAKLGKLPGSSRERLSSRAMKARRSSGSSISLCPDLARRLRNWSRMAMLMS